LIDVLEARRLLAEDARARVESETDSSVLEAWLKKAATTSSTLEVFT
jgi:hypothetical protein